MKFIDDELWPMGEAYLSITERKYASSKNSDRINYYLKQLGRLDNQDWHAPAILYLSKFNNDPELTLQFFKDLDRLAYAMFIWRANINDRALRYGRLIKTIEEGEDLYAFDSPLQLTDTECEDVLVQLDGPIYEMTRVRLPVLLRLDETISTGGAIYDLPIITVEHILPQNPAPDSDWMLEFPDVGTREHWVHKIANLALLPRRKNASAGNLNFREKKKKYFLTNDAVPFALTSQVNSQEAWTPSVLEHRQRELIYVFKSIWRL